MMNNTLKKFKLNQLFKDEDTRFMISCGAKFSSIFIMSTFFIYYVIWLLISINSIYLETNALGLNPELRQAYIDHTLGFASAKLPLLLMFYVILFFVGAYLGKLLLRPFEVISKYVTDKVEGVETTYDPDLFSDYKFLTRFSELFFRYIDEARKEKILRPNVLPPQFGKVRTPPFERVFFFHFLLIITIVVLVTAYSMVIFVSTINEYLITLALETIGSKKAVIAEFIMNQSSIFNTTVTLAVILTSIGYITLSFHLYSKVSGAVFAYFATMRSFMRGNHEARVHLIGYAHIRPHGRAFNKYLDLVARECRTEDNKS